MHLHEYGYLTQEDIQLKLDQLKSSHPDLAYTLLIFDEKTENGNDIIAFRVGLGHASADEKTTPNDKPGPTTKPVVLVTSLHHGNELITTIVGLALVDDFVTCQGSHCLNNYINIIWVPHLNIDGLMEQDRTGLIVNRKNLNKQGCVHNGGVDLNRNYGFHFGVETQDCQSIEYQGSSSFSEPETRFIRYLAEKQNIISAANLHSFGNLWAIPYNCCVDVHMEDNQQKAYDYVKKSVTGIEEFASSINSKILGYASYGSCSDYLLHEHGIIAMSPELGNESDGFIPPPTRFKSLIDSSLPNLNQILQRSAPVDLHLADESGSISLVNESWYGMYNDNHTAVCDIMLKTTPTKNLRDSKHQSLTMKIEPLTEYKLDIENFNLMNDTLDVQCKTEQANFMCFHKGIDSPDLYRIPCNPNLVYIPESTERTMVTAAGFVIISIFARKLLISMYKRS